MSQIRTLGLSQTTNRVMMPSEATVQLGKTLCVL